MAPIVPGKDVSGPQNLLCPAWPLLEVLIYFPPTLSQVQVACVSSFDFRFALFTHQAQKTKEKAQYF